MFLALQVISDVLYIFKQHQMKTRPNEFGSMYGSVPYVLLFIVHMYYDFHGRVCTTIDSHKYYTFFSDSHTVLPRLVSMRTIKLMSFSERKLTMRAHYSAVHILA